jgi:hypothetical protein
MQRYKTALRGAYRRLRERPSLAMPLAFVDLFLRPNAFLKQLGWFDTYRTRMPVTPDGPLPWLTFPAISFLEPRLRTELRVFEYGAGYSTLWWASRVKSVISCEHDELWIEEMRRRVPSNVKLIHHRLVAEIEQYCSEASRHVSDIIVIDGRNRVECAKRCLPGLSPQGVIVWDNSDRNRYAEGFEFLKENGFRRLDFTGVGPVNITMWCTSIFYRPDNCLGI